MADLSKSVCVCVWLAESVSTQHDSAFDLANAAKGSLSVGIWQDIGTEQTGMCIVVKFIYLFADMAFQAITVVSCSVTCILFCIIIILLAGL